MPVTRYPLLDGSIPVLDPGRLYSDRTAAPQDFWGRASSIHCPTGISPGIAYFVVNRATNDSLSMNTTHSISWVHENGTTTWQNYVICRQWMVGVDGDGKSAALVELRDKRQLMVGAAQQNYNMRRHSGGTYSTSSSDVSQYYTDSLNSSALWTWQEVLNDLWNYLPSAIRGTAPTLPYIPQVKPQNLNYFGDAWTFIGDLLARCQSQLVYDPIADAFTVVRIGAAQANLASQVAALKPRVMFDATPRQNLQLASIPETIRFYFPKYGIPNQTAAGGQTVRPYYTIDKPSNLAGCQAGTKKPYMTSFQAVYNSQTDADKANYPPANDTELQNLADELAEKIADKIDLGSERGRIIWSGIVPTTALALGSEVASICWRDYGGDEGCVTDARTAEELPEGEAPRAEPLPRVSLATPTLARLSGTLAAADWGSNSTLPPTNHRFTSTAQGTIYAISEDGANQYRYQSIADNEKILNPTPFEFANGSTVKVANHNGLWICQGPATGAVGIMVPLSGTYYSGSTLDLTFDTPTWDIGAIFTRSGETLTVAAPLANDQILFHCEWHVAVAAGWNSPPMLTAAYMLQNGVLRGYSSHQFNPSTTAPLGTVNLSHTHHDSRDMVLVKNDTLKVRVEFSTGGMGSTNVLGFLRITPMAGMQIF